MIETARTRPIDARDVRTLADEAEELEHDVTRSGVTTDYALVLVINEDSDGEGYASVAIQPDNDPEALYSSAEAFAEAYADEDISEDMKRADAQAQSLIERETGISWDGETEHLIDNGTVRKLTVTDITNRGFVRESLLEGWSEQQLAEELAQS